MNKPRGYIGFTNRKHFVHGDSDTVPVIIAEPIVDSYGSVLMFKTADDATRSGAIEVKALVTAKMPRKKKPQPRG